MHAGAERQTVGHCAGCFSVCDLSLGLYAVFRRETILKELTLVGGKTGNNSHLPQIKFHLTQVNLEPGNDWLA